MRQFGARGVAAVEMPRPQINRHKTRQHIGSPCPFQTRDGPAIADIRHGCMRGETGIGDRPHQQDMGVPEPDSPRTIFAGAAPCRGQCHAMRGFERRSKILAPQGCQKRQMASMDPRQGYIANS